MFALPTRAPETADAGRLPRSSSSGCSNDEDLGPCVRPVRPLATSGHEQVSAAAPAPAARGARGCARSPQGWLEPSLAGANTDDKFQFERHGYFVADRIDHAAARPVFNRITALKDGWAK
jgi:hypothetical protein